MSRPVVARCGLCAVNLEGVIVGADVRCHEHGPERPGQGATDPLNAVGALIAEECNALRDMLIEKNRAYGNSALDPVRMFSKAPIDEQIRVRLDDKLSRLARGEAAGEDVEQDLLGYLVLLRVSRRLGVDR